MIVNWSQTCPGRKKIGQHPGQHRKTTAGQQGARGGKNSKELCVLLDRKIEMAHTARSAIKFAIGNGKKNGVPVLPFAVWSFG